MLAHVDRAGNLLPPDDDRGGIGDPRSAQTELDSAKALHEGILTLIRQVISGTPDKSVLGLEDLINSRQGAQGTADSARAQIGNARNHIDSTITAKEYRLDKALKRAQALWISARSELAAADQIMADPIQPENVVDWPAAHAAAQKALQHALDSYAEVDEQIRAHEQALANLGLYGQKRREADAALSAARADQTVLQQWHNSRTWASVARHIATAEAHLQDAATHRRSAQTAISLQVQDFEGGLGASQAALQQIASAKAQAEALSEVKTTLEAYRAAWKGKQRAASSAIASADSKIKSVGRGHSRRAVNALNDAQSSLASAKTSANSYQWEQANHQADAARSAANHAENWVAIDATATQVGSDRLTRVAAQKTSSAAIRKTRAAESATKAASAAETKAARQDSEGAFSQDPSNDGGGFGDPPSSDGSGWNSVLPPFRRLIDNWSKGRHPTPTATPVPGQ